MATKIKNNEKDERPTSNIERPTSNNDVAPLRQFINFFCLVPILRRGNPYGMHSHAGAWERKIKLLAISLSE
jgi:hypothetical protein